MKIFRWTFWWAKKKPDFREKIKIVVRDGRFVKAKIPYWAKCSTEQYCAARQLVACYQIKLNGNEFGGLGGLGGVYES